MVAKNQKAKINLNRVAIEKLPKRLIDAIGKMEFTIEELQEYESNKPSVRLSVTREEVIIEMRTQIPIDKILKAFGGTGGLIGFFLVIKEFVL